MQSESFKTPSVVVTGNFDGCHLGHQSLFNQIEDYGASNSLTPLVLSFDKHTRSVIKNIEMKLLSPQAEKVQWFKERGLSLACLNFKTEIMLLSAKEFVLNILIDRFGAKTWVVGFDHRFGNDLQEFDEDFVKWASNHGLTILEGQELELKGEKVNSTLVRDSLELGDVAKVNALLGRPYSVVGEVVKGDQIGRTIDFPTANLKVDINKQLPAPGVYGGVVKINKKLYKAMTHLGVRPTLNESDVRLEVFVLGYSGDLYGQTLSFDFIQKIRDIVKFESLDSLKNQLKKDEIIWESSTL